MFAKGVSVDVHAARAFEARPAAKAAKAVEGASGAVSGGKVEGLGTVLRPAVECWIGAGGEGGGSWGTGRRGREDGRDITP